MIQTSRTLRGRPVTNENDENAATTRLTRAKSAAMGTTDASTDVPKKTVQSKKSTTTLGANGTAQARKRPALGDVSNVTKTDGLGAGAKDGKDAKKSLATKAGLVSKAAHPTKIQKPSRTTSTRSVLAPKEKNATSSELKRPASGSGIAGHVTKKRTTSTTGESH
jgi:hypothetical protein